MFELQAKSKVHAEVRLHGSVSDWGKVSPEQVDDSLQNVASKGYKKVLLRLHSPGGAIFPGTAITTSMDHSNLHITSRVEGLAASYAGIILQRSDVRQMVQGTRLMIHQGSGVVGGSARRISEYAENLKSLNEDLADIFAEKTGKDKQWILDNWMAEGQDKWFTADQALKAGLIDEIIPRKGNKMPKETANYSFTEMAAYYDNELLEDNNEDEMKKELIKRLGLKAEATDEEINAALDALETKANQEPQTDALAQTESVEAFMTMGETMGMITKENKETVKTMAETAGVKVTAAFLAAHKVEKPAADDGARMSDLIDALKDGKKPEATDKTWDEMTEKEKAELEDKDPEKFEALFEASFGDVKNGGGN